MLLVHDDQADVRRGREEGRARADDDRALAASHQFPLGVAFGIFEARVEDRDLTGETIGEPGDDLRGQRDLRHQDQRLPPGTHRRPGGAQIDLGLARAGDAVQQEWRELVRGDRRRERLPDARSVAGSAGAGLRSVSGGGFAARSCPVRRKPRRSLSLPGHAGSPGSPRSVDRHPRAATARAWSACSSVPRRA